MESQIVPIVIIVALLAAVLLLRNQKPRPLRLDRLWLRPVLAIVLVASTLRQYPPQLTAANISLLVLAGVAGAALGWQRGRFMQIEIDPATHAASARMSMWGMVFVLALFGARYLLRANASQVGLFSGGMITDALMILTGGMMAAQQIEVTLRARRLIDEARNAPPAL